MDVTWMAWTWQTGVFFAVIALALVVMTGLAVRFPETERIGILGLSTTRGDRLFISLLGAAFIHIGWLALLGPDIWWASAVSLVYAVVVFRKV